MDETLGQAERKLLVRILLERAAESDRAEQALSLYYDNGDPALLEKLAKELVR